MQLKDMIYLAAASIYAGIPEETIATREQCMDASITQAKELWDAVCNREDL